MISKEKTKAILAKVVPLRTLPTSSFHIVNVVGTVQILSLGETLSIELLPAYLGGMAKFIPNSFAAVILRIKDCISTTTSLVFRSGKLVCVGAHTRYHSLLACQTYREIIQTVPSIFSFNGKLGVYTLEGRTKFLNWNVENIVAHDDLKCQINLKYISEFIPDLTNWNHELFPGMKLLVWISPKSNCKCIKKKKNKSCKCNLRVLLFDTGKCVETGCTDLNSLLLGASILRNIFIEDTFKETSLSNSNNNNRFEQRKQKIKDAAYLEFAGWRNNIKKKKEDNTDAVITIEGLFKGLKKMPKKRLKTEEESNDCPVFVKACKDGMIERVKFFSEFDKKAILEALKYEDMFDKHVMKILKEHMDEQIL